MSNTMTVNTSNSTSMNDPRWDNSHWAGSDAKMCATCNQWYAGAHYCPGKHYVPNVWPHQVTPGKPAVPPTPVNPEVEVVEVRVKICPRCEEDKRVDTEWDDNDYICRECRYGPDSVDD